MQNRVTIDGWSAKQPNEFTWRFETTSTEDSGRSMSGFAMITPLFTVEAFEIEYTGLTIAQAKTLLLAIVQRPKKPYFTMHYFSPYFGVWRNAQFYVGDGTLEVRTLRDGNEIMQTISFSAVGREKLA